MKNKLLASCLMLLASAAFASGGEAAGAAPTDAAKSGANAKTFETTLDNGLRVIVREDNRAPSVVHMVWYRAGAMDETNGVSGVAHVLEHLMFKGTQNFAPGEFNERVAAAGGHDNAFTSHDFTAYFQITPNAALPEMMTLEADRMSNLQLTAEDFASEIQVVMEERRLRTEDNPEALLHEALDAATFSAHPYRRPIVGWMDDLQHMTREDALAWYQSWYAPNNATVVVVGDVDHEAVFKLAAETYGGLKARSMPVRKPQNEPPQRGVRRIEVKAPAKLPYLVMVWRAPKLQDVDNDRDPYVLKVLAAVLDGGDAARFSKNLVRGAGVAQSAGAWYSAVVRGEAVFTIDGKPAKGHSVSDLEKALRKEIQRIQEEGVDAAELKRVKTRTIASEVYKRDSMMAQAMEIGHLETNGLNWSDIDKLQEKLRSVTALEVQAAAQKYFDDDALTIAVLKPQPLAAEPTAAVAIDSRH